MIQQREADIIVHEINPQETTIELLSSMILRVAYPRGLKHNAAGKRIWLDSGVADKAGRARSDHTGISAFKLIRRAPEDGGIGIALRSNTDPVKD